MKRILGLFVVLLIITGCGKKYDPYEVPEEVVIELNENVFRVYDEHKSQDLVKSSNVDITSNELLKTDEIGKQTYTLTYTYNSTNNNFDVTGTGPITGTMATNIEQSGWLEYGMSDDIIGTASLSNATVSKINLAATMTGAKVTPVISRTQETIDGAINVGT